MIADDHALLRQGIKNVLALEADFCVVGEAIDGEDAIEQAKNLQPDIVLLDINMPKMNGLEVTREIRARLPRMRVVILTIHDDENYVFEVVRSGAAGYLLKDVEPSMLVQAIRLINEGQSFIYPTLTRSLFDEISRRDEVVSMLDKRKEERLTYREIEVLKLVGEGMSNIEIADKLYLSQKTVKNHLTNIFRKISVGDRTQAVLYAIKNKIVVIE